jgi:hypothetical protein
MSAVGLGPKLAGDDTMAEAVTYSIAVANSISYGAAAAAYQAFQQAKEGVAAGAADAGTGEAAAAAVQRMEQLAKPMKKALKQQAVPEALVSAPEDPSPVNFADLFGLAGSDSEEEGEVLGSQGAAKAAAAGGQRQKPGAGAAGLQQRAAAAGNMQPLAPAAAMAPAGEAEGSGRKRDREDASEGKEGTEGSDMDEVRSACVLPCGPNISSQWRGRLTYSLPAPVSVCLRVLRGGLCMGSAMCRASRWENVPSAKAAEQRHNASLCVHGHRAQHTVVYAATTWQATHTCRLQRPCNTLPYICEQVHERTMMQCTYYSVEEALGSPGATAGGRHTVARSWMSRMHVAPPQYHVYNTPHSCAAWCAAGSGRVILGGGVRVTCQCPLSRGSAPTVTGDVRHDVLDAGGQLLHTPEYLWRSYARWPL